MTGLSRCGRQYRTFESAVLAGELRTSKGARRLAVVSCDLGDHWRLVPPRSVAYSSPDPFPPPVRKLLTARDECCQRCGWAGSGNTRGGLKAHHRRAKASGGSSSRAHTQCACNGVLLCRKCHEWAHLNPRQARAEGWTVLQSVSRPGSVWMIPFAPHSDPLGILPLARWYPTCDGGWNDQP